MKRKRVDEDLQSLRSVLRLVRDVTFEKLENSLDVI